MENFEQFLGREKTVWHRWRLYVVSLTFFLLFLTYYLGLQELDRVSHHDAAATVKIQTLLFIALLVVSLLAVAVLFLFNSNSTKKHTETIETLFRLSQALEHSGEGIIIADQNGTIEYANDAFCHMTGYSRDATIGNNPSMLSSGRQSDAFYDNLWSTISDGKVWRGELYNRKKDGTIYPALMTIGPISDQGGSVTHYVATQQDMTDHNAVVEQLYQAQKLDAIGTLAGGIAHDFNNCLTVITGNVFLLHNEVDNPEQIRRSLDIIDKSCNQAATHIKQLLSFSRKDPVVMETIEINACAESACDMASSIIPSNISISCATYEHKLYTRWNKTQAQQVLINLINNACHALKNREHPAISIRLSLFANDAYFMSKHPDMGDRQYICLSVRDNGSGIPPEIAHCIFDPFFTTKDVDEGTGLGLSMAYGALKKVNGTIEMESEVGQGTEFRLFLPMES